MRLAKSIYNKQGTLLYDRGSTLSDPIIVNIQKFGLLGVLILDAAEPLPPITPEEQKFEQLQTAYMLRLRECLIAISKGGVPTDLPMLVADIQKNFGNINHRVSFSQTIRSSEDYNYKHAVCTAILSTMIAHHLNYTSEAASSLIAAALLADFGYLYVPKNIMNKADSALTSNDLLSIEQYRQKAFALLKPDTNPYGLTPETFTALTEFLKVPRRENPELDITSFSLNTKILMVADKYDRMTAMSINYEPVSSVAALRHLEGGDSIYEAFVVGALASSLSVLPVGQCVELSTHNHGMIVAENPSNMFRPRVLDLSTNKIYDLNNPKLHGILEVKDILTSLDQRYICDEQTLKQFVPDAPLQNMTRRFRIRLANAKKRKAARMSKAASADMNGLSN